MLIYLADLGHNQLTRSSDVYPLGVSNLKAFALRYYRTGEPLEVRIFREPQDLKAALDASAPDILGLSCYPWNHELSLHFAGYCKALNRGVLTVMGGPNFPIADSDRERFLKEAPWVDLFTRGPNSEGERAFLNVVERFSEARLSIEGLMEGPVAGALWLDHASGELVKGGDVERITDLDEIPSPYRLGLMDGFFETGYFPLLQLTRGCPFSCTYCNSGVDSNSRVAAHSIEDVKADLLYIAERVKPQMPLCLADDNFGMYAMDEEVADYLGELQRTHDWPHYIRTTTGKNNAERIIRVMRKTGGILPMTAAVQSMNPKVLRTIKRDNIRIEAYHKILRELESTGMQSYGELILCLPEETLATFMKSVEDLMDAGVKRISAHQLMLLNGAPLNSPEDRERFAFETQFRVVARNIGDYTGSPVVEVEEIVVATGTFSFEDYLKARIFHLLLTIFYYEGNFEEAFEFAEKDCGVKPFDVMVRMEEMLDQAPVGFRSLIDDFVAESKDELFKTMEGCHRWAEENFEGLVSGEVGGNLLSKYSMLGRFFLFRESLEFLETTLGGFSRSDDLAFKLKEVMEYLRSVMLYSPFAECLDALVTLRTSFDIDGWRNDGFTSGLDPYRYAEPKEFTASVDEEKVALIKTKLSTFGEHPAGLGKFTRTMFAQDLRRTLTPGTSGDGNP